jgi:hypothetical protein
MSDQDKLNTPHVFRWIDHIQHLPGMLEIVKDKGSFVSFPNEEEIVPLSKSQQKKLAKVQASKDKKGGKPEEGKKEDGKKEEEKKTEQPKKPKQ